VQALRNFGCGEGPLREVCEEEQCPSPEKSSEMDFKMATF